MAKYLNMQVLECAENGSKTALAAFDKWFQEGMTALLAAQKINPSPLLTLMLYSAYRTFKALRGAKDTVKAHSEMRDALFDCIKAMNTIAIPALTGLTQDFDRLQLFSARIEKEIENQMLQAKIQLELAEKGESADEG